MNLTLELGSEQGVQLLELAERERISPDSLLRQAVESLLAASNRPTGPRRPKKSSFGMLAHLGPAPSAEDIAEVRKEMFATFPRDPAK